MDKIYVLIVTTSNIYDTPDFGISDLGQIYKSKEEAIDTVTKCYGYKPVKGQKDIFERIADGGKFRHRYKIIEKSVW